jgi:hypothetical protein
MLEATARPLTWSQKIGSDGTIIPKRVLYIDYIESEGWFVTASDQYNSPGQLWKTIATFNAYRDRPVPDAKVAIYPYKRMFQTPWSMRMCRTGSRRSCTYRAAKPRSTSAGTSTWA